MRKWRIFVSNVLIRSKIQFEYFGVKKERCKPRGGGGSFKVCNRKVIWGGRSERGRK